MFIEARAYLSPWSHRRIPAEWTRVGSETDAGFCADPLSTAVGSAAALWSREARRAQPARGAVCDTGVSGPLICITKQQ